MRIGATLMGVEIQSARYAPRLPTAPARELAPERFRLTAADRSQTEGFGPTMRPIGPALPQESISHTQFGDQPSSGLPKHTTIASTSRAPRRVADRQTKREPKVDRGWIADIQYLNPVFIGIAGVRSWQGTPA
jgi:hypothetical protein